MSIRFTRCPELIRLRDERARAYLDRDFEAAHKILVRESEHIQTCPYCSGKPAGLAEQLWPGVKVGG